MVGCRSKTYRGVRKSCAENELTDRMVIQIPIAAYLRGRDKSKSLRRQMGNLIDQRNGFAYIPEIQHRRGRMSKSKVREDKKRKLKKRIWQGNEGPKSVLPPGRKKYDDRGFCDSDGLRVTRRENYTKGLVYSDEIAQVVEAGLGKKLKGKRLRFKRSSRGTTGRN